MVIIKIIIIAIICAIISLYLKKYNPEIAIISTIAGGLLVIFFIADYIFGVVAEMRSFFNASGLDSELIKLIIKVAIIAYLVEFAAGTVRDLGEISLSEKILLAGKIAILTMSFPIIKSLFTLIVEVSNV